MSKSVSRVKRGAEAMGLKIDIQRLGEDMRTAKAAADALGCDVGRVAKSLVFVGAQTDTLYLLLVSGACRADLDLAAGMSGETLVKADAKQVRARSGFVIGGVAPFGHLEAPKVLIDDTLMSHRTVWSAGGAPDAVFEIATPDLVTATHGSVVKIGVPIT